MGEVFRTLRKIDPDLARDAKEYQQAYEAQNYPKNVTFFEVIRKFLPEDYPVIVADCRLYPNKLPQNLREANPEASVLDIDPPDAEEAAPKAAKSKKADKPDPKHWEGKKRRTDGNQWIYDNIGNEEADWRTAPSLGDWNCLQDLNKNPNLRSKFYEAKWRADGQAKEEDERAALLNDDGAFVDADYARIQEVVRNLRQDQRKEVIGLT